MTAVGGQGISRREFLAAANAAALLLLVESCSLGPLARKAAASPAVPAGATPQEQALRLMLQAIRSSPDHLALRAEDMVAAKDADRIVQFVRDHIAAIPPFAASDDARTARRWGSAATLRGGVGTLRERADVLADLLTRAGFKATVGVAARPGGIGVEELYRARLTDFAPDEPRVRLAESILRRAGLPAPASPQASPPAPDPLEAILSALPATTQVGRVRDDLLPAQVPVVSFQDGAKTRYAFALGDLGVSDSAPSGLHVAGGPDDLRKVAITVSAVASPALGSATPGGKLMDLVSGTWPADQVVGRQVLLTFPPVQGPLTLLESSLAALPVRAPLLLVQAGEPSGRPSQDLLASGPPITVQGDVLASPGGASTDLAGPFGTIAALSDSDRRRLAAGVRSIRAVANAASFPEVEVDVAVTDGAGVPVNGLDGQAFAVAEGGKAVDGFTLFSGTAVQQRARVLLVYDAAFQDMWPSATAKASFESSITQALVAQAARTPFDVQVIGLGAAPDPQRWGPPQAGQLSAALGAASESADDPWKTVGGAALDQGVAAIVLVSDMDPLDADARLVPTYERRLAASRVPVLVAPVGHVDEPTASRILSAGGGIRLDPADPATPAKIAAWIGPLVTGWIGGGYRIRYTAPASGAAQRTVTVGVAQGTAPVATATYSVPDRPVPPPSFAGLYVTIRFGGMSTFRRIAGVEMTEGGAVLGPLDDPAAIAETRAALNGITTIAIEPGTPTRAAVLDDVVTSMLSVEPIRALGKATPKQVVKVASAAGVRRTPIALAMMLMLEPSAPGAVFGLRTVILQERSLAPGTLEAHADFAVGANEVVPLVADRHAAFRAVAATSLTSSFAESLVLPVSAYDRLSGRSLLAISSGDYAAINTYMASVPPSKAAAWNAAFKLYADFAVAVPHAGEVDALWVVEPATGAVKAVLLDGTGGATIRGDGCHLSAEDGLALAIAVLAMICSVMPAGLSYYCAGVNVAATGMCVVQLFDGSYDMGTPFSLYIGLANPFGTTPLGKASAAGFSLALILLTLASAGCISLA